MSELPKEAEALLSVAPGDFVTERNGLARKLREAGRDAEAAEVAALRKPAPVVLAANHAARAEPKVARELARAAKQVRKQLGRDDEARAKLDGAVASLERVALAFLGQPTEATRRRLRDLLRNAVADDVACAALARGVLTDEPEPAGFAAYSGVSLAPARRSTKGDSRAAEQAEQKRREREQALRDELAAAGERLEQALDAERKASRERAAAERAVEVARERLEKHSA